MPHTHRELYNCYLHSSSACNLSGLPLHVLYTTLSFKKSVNLRLTFEHTTRMNKPVLLVSLVMVKAASGLDAATSSLTSAAIPAAMLLAIFSDDESLGGSPNGCK